MNKFKRSLLPKELRGIVIAITGQYSSGKSFLSLFDPYNTVFLDMDYGKAKVIADQVPAMKYVSLNRNEVGNVTKMAENFIQWLLSENFSKVTAVVMDNFYELQESMRVYAIKNPVQFAKDYGLVAESISGRSYGNDIIAGEKILKAAVNYLQSQNITVIIISHMKDKWFNNRKVLGQKEMKVREWVLEAASLAFILTKTGSAPDAIVLKDSFSYIIPIDPNELSDDDFEKYRSGNLVTNKVIQRLPLKIPGITPSKIFGYLSRTPEEASKPCLPDEILDMDELAPYSEILSKGQLAKLETIMEQQEKEQIQYQKEIESIKQAQRTEMNTFIIDNADLPIADILAYVNENFELFAAEVDPPYILTIRNSQE